MSSNSDVSNTLIKIHAMYGHDTQSKSVINQSINRLVEIKCNIKCLLIFVSDCNKAL
jgi:hypothetical protein